MPAINSTMMPLGMTAPDFALVDTTGRTVRRADFAGRPLLVMFICNHCPYVVHVRAQLATIGRDYADRVGIVAINPNDVEAYPDDRPEMMVEEVRRAGYGFPYLFDETQAVALAYGASCTPDFFLFDGAHELVYRGQLDGSRPGSDRPVTGADLRGALDAVLAGRDVTEDQRPSLGCSIKWKRGNEPE